MDARQGSKSSGAFPGLLNIFPFGEPSALDMATRADPREVRALIGLLGLDQTHLLPVAMALF